MANLPYAKKSLGQHWLTDSAALEDIANAVDIKGKTVLEIGPGPGALTKYLVKSASQVIAVEFDTELSSKLAKNLDNPSNLKVVNQDILKFNFSDLPNNYVVVANIPYYLTSKLIRVICESDNQPDQAVILVQKEVAERIAAKPGKMSLLSVSTQVFYEPNLGSVVPANMFTPPPKVDSRVVIMQKRRAPLIAKDLQQHFFNIVKAGFSERRKKLRSSLSGGLRISKTQADELIESAGLSPDSRAQELSIEQWQELAGKSTSI